MSDEKIIDTKLEPISEEDLNLSEKFGHVEKLGNDIAKKKESLVLPEVKEAKEVVDAEKDAAYAKIASRLTKDNDDEEAAAVKSDAALVAKKNDAEDQIQHLLDLSKVKGVVYAVKVARQVDDNYILDMLHDKMIGEEFQKALAKEGEI